MFQKQFIIFHIYAYYSVLIYKQFNFKIINSTRGMKEGINNIDEDKKVIESLLKTDHVWKSKHTNLVSSLNSLFSLNDHFETSDELSAKRRVDYKNTNHRNSTKSSANNNKIIAFQLKLCKLLFESIDCCGDCYDLFYLWKMKLTSKQSFLDEYEKKQIIEELSGDNKIQLTVKILLSEWRMLKYDDVRLLWTNNVEKFIFGQYSVSRFTFSMIVLFLHNIDNFKHFASVILLMQQEGTLFLHTNKEEWDYVYNFYHQKFKGNSHFEVSDQKILHTLFIYMCMEGVYFDERINEILFLYHDIFTKKHLDFLVLKIIVLVYRKTNKVDGILKNSIIDIIGSDTVLKIVSKDSYAFRNEFLLYTQDIYFLIDLLPIFINLKLADIHFMILSNLKDEIVKNCYYKSILENSDKIQLKQLITKFSFYEDLMYFALRNNLLNTNQTKFSKSLVKRSLELLISEFYNFEKKSETNLSYSLLAQWNTIFIKLNDHLKSIKSDKYVILQDTDVLLEFFFFDISEYVQKTNQKLADIYRKFKRNFVLLCNNDSKFFNLSCKNKNFYNFIMKIYDNIEYIDFSPSIIDKIYLFYQKYKISLPDYSSVLRILENYPFDEFLLLSLINLLSIQEFNEPTYEILIDMIDKIDKTIDQNVINSISEKLHSINNVYSNEIYSLLENKEYINIERSISFEENLKSDSNDSQNDKTINYTKNTQKIEEKFDINADERIPYLNKDEDLKKESKYKVSECQDENPIIKTEKVYNENPECGINKKKNQSVSLDLAEKVKSIEENVGIFQDYNNIKSEKNIKLMSETAKFFLDEGLPIKNNVFTDSCPNSSNNINNERMELNNRDNMTKSSQFLKKRYKPAECNDKKIAQYMPKQIISTNSKTETYNAMSKRAHIIPQSNIADELQKKNKRMKLINNFENEAMNNFKETDKSQSPVRNYEMFKDIKLISESYNKDSFKAIKKKSTKFQRQNIPSPPSSAFVLGNSKKRFNIKKRNNINQNEKSGSNIVPNQFKKYNQQKLDAYKGCHNFDPYEFSDLNLLPPSSKAKEVNIDTDFIYVSLLNNQSFIEHLDSQKITFMTQKDYINFFSPLVINEIKTNMTKEIEVINNSETESVTCVDLIDTEKFLFEIFASSKKTINYVENDLVAFSLSDIPNETNVFFGIFKDSYFVKGSYISKFIIGNRNLINRGDTLLHRFTASLNTYFREYNALFQLEYFQNKSLILNPNLINKESPTQSEVEKFKNEFDINIYQAEVLAAFSRPNNKITLTQGPPGSGKTTLIVSLCSAFLSNMIKVDRVEGKSRILICAPSNTAIDEIVRRLDKGIALPNGTFFKPFILRIGVTSNLSSEAKQHSLEHLVDEMNELNVTQRNLKKMDLLMKSDVICSTLSSSIHDSLFLTKLNLDILVIDEACQSVEPSTIIPFKHNPRKIMLIGDPKQLPPTVINQSSFYEFSLFQRLSRFYNPYILEMQYRMSNGIMELPNRLFYNSLLKTDDNCLNRSNIYEKILDPITFVDVNGNEACTDSNGYINTLEANKIISLLISIESKIELSTVAVITPYKAQSNLITKLIKEKIPSLLNNVRINTVDAFQGQEKDLVIISVVRSNKIGFTNDERRLNVALTRAKHACIIFGNVKFLLSDDLWHKIISYCDSKNYLHVVSSFFNMIEQKKLKE